MPAFQDMWPRWRQAVGRAAQRGVLSDRTRADASPTNPRRWLPDQAGTGGRSHRGGDHALLVRVRTTTPQQFGQWIGAPPTAAEQFERHSQKLTKINFDDVPAWVSYQDTEMPQAEGAKGGVLLLPYFDAYAVGSHPRDRLFPGKAAAPRAVRPGWQLSGSAH